MNRPVKVGTEQNRSPINACPLVCHLPQLRDNPDYYSQKKTLPQLKKTHPWYVTTCLYVR
ncbi:hypothetical protein QUB10_26780 [Microcoleus sp. B5-D4]|uniref:hypothetical protein n=1 Tax=unclassified Microcoleus TaxID=2642155 RepID=UPI003B152F75